MVNSYLGVDFYFGDIMLPVGRYRTEKGSTMTISGKYAGKSKVSFDWLEEGACCDCKPEPYEDEGYLVWHCDECGGGKAKLFIDI